MVVTLSYQSVVDEGEKLVRQSGWPRLSLRAVAASLGVTPMALYRYVPDSKSLSQAVIERIAESLAEVRDSGDLFADMDRWARRAHNSLVPYPGAAARLLTTWFQVSAALRAIEGLLGIVNRGGLQGFEAVAAVNAVFMYVLMRVQAEETVREAGAVRRKLPFVNGETTLPLLSALAEHYTTARFDLHFDYGLRVLLDGIAARGQGGPGATGSEGKH